MSLARGGAVVLWIAGLLACALVVLRGEFSTDMSAFLPRSPVPAQQILVEQMRDGVVSRMVLIGIAGEPPPVLAALSKATAEALRGAPDFALVANGENAGLERDQEFLWRNRYLLSPGVVPERFTAAGLRRALENDLQMLGSDAGMLVKRTLPADPTGEILALVETLAGTQHPATRDGVWFAKDGGSAVMMVQTRAAGFDIDAQQHALALIDQAFASAKQEIGASGARLEVTGPPVFAVHARATMQGDATRFSLIATALVAALLLFAYRRPRVVVLALCPVVSGAVAGVAAVSLGFGYVHGITLGFGVTLIGEAVDYAIYLFTQTVPGSPPTATLPRIWPTLRLGMLTSICGFSAMLLSSFTGFAQLGLFTIVGLAVALGVTRWVLPLLLPRNFTNLSSTVFAPPLLALIRHAARLRIAVWVLVALGVVSLALHRGGMWEDQIESMSPISAADKALDARMRSNTSAPDVRYLLGIERPDAESALEASTKLSAVLTDLVARGELTGFDAPQLILPSQATQRARQEALPEPETLRANLEEALSGLPFRLETFAPFLPDVAAARTQPLLDRASLAGTSLATKLDSLLIQRKGGWIAMLPLRGAVDAPRLAATVAAASDPDAIFLDLKGESDRLLETYLHEAIMLSLIGSLVIVALLGLSLRSLRRVATVLAPLVATVLVTAGLLALGPQKLSIFNLFGLLLVVAVGSNYCLFFERQATAGEIRERTLASLVLANLCTVIGFGVLAFSHIPVLYGIGETVAIGALLSLVFAAILTAHPLVAPSAAPAGEPAQWS
jgi:predicted exporter